MSTDLRSARVLGLSSSEPEYFSTAGGVGAARHYLFRELAGRCASFERFQPPLPDGLADGASRTATQHRSRKRAPAVVEAKSRAVERHVAALRPPADLIFQWEFFFRPWWTAPSPVPYVLYNDWTTRLTQREFPGWADADSLEPFHRLQVPLLRQAAHVFTFSEKVRRSVVDDYGVAADRVTTVFTGVNLERFPADGAEKDHTAQHILFVGNDYAVKGLPTLLDAFAAVAPEFPRAQLSVVGEPGGTGIPRAPGERVHVHGAVRDKAQLDRLYRAATIFALPSRMEAFGHVYAEAMAHQTACVGGDRGAVPEIIEDGRTGFVVPIDDAGALAARLRELLASASLRRDMGRAGYDRARRDFRWSTVVDKMVAPIDRVLARAAPAGRVGGQCGVPSPARSSKRGRPSSGIADHGAA